jgi:hypothetical protein
MSATAMSRSNYDRCLALTLSVHTRNKSGERAPGVRAAGLVSWIGEGSSRRLNGSAVERDALRWGIERVATFEDPSVTVLVPRRSGRMQTSPGSVSTEFGRGCAMGFGESVARVPPGRTGCIALRVGIRIDSSIADFDSWHRARSSRWSGLGSGVAGVTHDARLYDSRRRKGCGVSSIQNQGMGERRPSHEGSAGRSQVCECVSWAAVPRSCVSVLTGQVGLTTRLLLVWRPGEAAPFGQAHLRFAWMAFGSFAEPTCGP